MGAVWHLLHALLWLLCIFFFWEEERPEADSGIRLSHPEFVAESKGENWKISAQKGFLDPDGFSKLELRNEVRLVWKDIECEAESVFWNLQSGTVTLERPAIRKEYGFDAFQLELTQESRGYHLEGLETEMEIPIRSGDRYPLRVQKLSLPMRSLGRLIRVGEELRQPISHRPQASKKIANEGSDQQLEIHPWVLKAGTLSIGQSVFYLRAMFSDLHLSRGELSLSAKSVRAKWSPLRWVMKDGVFVGRKGERTFVDGVLFLDSGKLLLDRKEVAFP